MQRFDPLVELFCRRFQQECLQREWQNEESGDEQQLLGFVLSYLHRSSLLPMQFLRRDEDIFIQVANDAERYEISYEYLMQQGRGLRSGQAFDWSQLTSLKKENPDIS